MLQNNYKYKKLIDNYIDSLSLIKRITSHWTVLGNEN